MGNVLEHLATPEPALDPSDDIRQSLGVTVSKAPDQEGDFVHVKATDYGDDHVFECRWTPRDGRFPQVGDEGIISFDEDGEPWLVAWEPTSGVNTRYEDMLEGDGVALSFVVIHNMNTRRVQVTVQQAQSPWEFVSPTVIATTLDSVTLTFSVAPAIGEDYMVTVRY